MSLPPERITVKRRRDEDPVEALYVQSKKHRPSAIWKLQPDSKGTSDSLDVSSREQGRKAEHASTDGLRASTIDALSSSQVIHDKQQGPGHSAVTTSGGGAPPFAPKITSGYTALRPHPSGQQRKPSPSRKTPVHPRKFYLAKGSFEILSRRSVSPAGISKTKRLRKSEVACFVEGRKRQAVGKERSRFQSKLDGKTPDAVSGSAVESSISRTERRKPHATAAEKAWRANEWNDPKTETSDASESNNVSTTSFADSNDDLLKLASELQAFALKQSQANEKSVSQPLSERSLKFKPKPPKDRPRRRDHQPGSVSPELDAFNEEDDFVMDTYIRSEFDSSRRSEHDEQMIDPTEHLQTENIGILIIEEEDEAIWDAYVGGLGTESDGVDEEEDENAEDFYGNDYPEDEIDDDDEFGRDPYRYRANGSDDEQYDEDRSWSDEEHDAFH